MNANEICKNLGKGALVLIALYLVIKGFNYQTKMVEKFSLNMDQIKSKAEEVETKAKVKSSVSTESSSSNSSKSTDNSTANDSSMAMASDDVQTAIEYYKSILSLDDSDAVEALKSAIEENEQLISLEVFLGSYYSCLYLKAAYKDPFASTETMDGVYDLIDKTNKLNQFRETLKTLPDILDNAVSSKKKSSWW
jgi:hypothetical protein